MKSRIFFLRWPISLRPRVQTNIKSLSHMILRGVHGTPPELPDYYRRNKNLGNILGRHTLKNNKLVSRNKPNQGKCHPCLSRRNNFCYKQMATTTKFTNRKTGRQFQIYHTVNCKSFYVIYIIECTLCLFKPYVGKCETTFDLGLNTHRTHAKCDNSIPVDTHFKSAGHDFTKHARVTIIEKLENTSMSKELITKTLKKRRLLDDQTRHTNAFWF